MSKVAAVVMAAGMGKRMKSSLPKVLHTVAGRPMLWYTAALARRVADATVGIIVGHGAEHVRAFLKSQEEALAPFSVVEQTEQRGTGHAVQQAKKILVKHNQCVANQCLILNGDTPLLTETTVRALLDHHQETQATVTILTAVLDDPQGYGRVVRGPYHEVLRVVEDQDASPEELTLDEVNVGTYVVEGSFLFEALKALDPRNAQGELYLTDIVHIAVNRGLRVSAMAAFDRNETIGINNREHLAFAEKEMRRRICARWMRAGVTLLDPERTRIDDEVIIGQDTILYPNVSLEGRTRIGQACMIRSNSRVTDSTMEDRVVIHDSCVVHGAVLDSESVVGPFAHLRPGTRLRRRAKVGNFVELKQADLGEGSKANHLSYLGDAVIGQGVNVGAGTITCNYDGYRKEQTIIEDQVFIGSDSQLIAPVRIGHGAIVAAGTTVTQDIPPNALGISRPAQVNKEGAAARRRALYDPPSPSSSTKTARTRAKGTKGKSKK